MGLSKDSAAILYRYLLSGNARILFLKTWAIQTQTMLTINHQPYFYYSKSKSKIAPGQLPKRRPSTLTACANFAVVGLAQPLVRCLIRTPQG